VSQLSDMANVCWISFKRRSNDHARSWLRKG
jgi:hypothetical protein